MGPALRPVQPAPWRPGGRGFQTIQGRVASSTEGGAESLTAKGLDALGSAMSAIADERMNGSVCDCKVATRSVGTGEALGVHPFGCSSSAFDLTPRSNRRRCWPDNQWVGAGEVTGWAIVGERGLSRR